MQSLFGKGEVVEWSITAVLKTVELKGSGGSNPSLSAKRMLTHSLFSFWATPKTASREGLKRQELALVSGKHSLGAGVAKQREKSDKSATHRFARAPAASGQGRRSALRDEIPNASTNSLWQPMCHRTRISIPPCQGGAKKVSLWQAIPHRVRSTPSSLPK